MNDSRVVSKETPIARLEVREGVQTRGKTIRRLSWIRSGFCLVHVKTSQDFVGTNEHGWIFRCPGWTKDEAKAINRKGRDPEKIMTGDAQPAVPLLAHYFVNREPTDEGTS